MILPTCAAHALETRAADHAWLIEGLWADQAVGIVGGEPKCCKSFLALDMAVAVATGRPCLRRFSVKRPGRVLLFPAEDALHVVRDRLEGICHAAGVPFGELDVHVITAGALRLDRADDQLRLKEAVARLRPALLVLDPFVRLHRIDENASGEVAPILAWLRQLQRDHALAVAVVHHAKKGASSARAGQALRGSSEFHAWGDSNLYLRRAGEELRLTVEHRAAPSQEGLALRLLQEGEALALAPVLAAATPPSAPLELKERIVNALREKADTLAGLRATCRVRTASLCETLALLTGDGTVCKTGATYALSEPTLA